MRRRNSEFLVRPSIRVPLARLYRALLKVDFDVVLEVGVVAFLAILLEARLHYLLLPVQHRVVEFIQVLVRIDGVEAFTNTNKFISETNPMDMHEYVIYNTGCKYECR